MYLYRSRSELGYKRENMVRTYSGTISLWFPTCRSCLWSCAGWLPPGSELSSGLRPRAAGEINPQHSLSQFHTLSSSVETRHIQSSRLQRINIARASYIEVWSQLWQQETGQKTSGGLLRARLHQLLVGFVTLSHTIFNILVSILIEQIGLRVLTCVGPV